MPRQDHESCLGSTGNLKLYFEPWLIVPLSMTAQGCIARIAERDYSELLKLRQMDSKHH
jgi:hypothetical protein